MSDMPNTRRTLITGSELPLYFAPSADGINIPLPMNRVRTGATVIVCGTRQSDYVVTIMNPSRGKSNDEAGFKRSTGTGVGSAVGKQVLKQVVSKPGWTLRQVGGFVGSRIGGAVVGMFVANPLARDGQMIKETHLYVPISAQDSYSFEELERGEHLSGEITYFIMD